MKYMGKTTEYVYAKILEYENNAGESFLDQYDGGIDVVPFMKYLLEVKTISEDKYELWREEYNKDDLSSIDAEMVMTVLSNEDGFDRPYVITQFTEDELEKAEDDYDGNLYELMYEKQMRPICEYLSLDRNKDLWDYLESEIQETIDYYKR